MKTSLSGRKYQRGVAVITALLLTTLAITIVASLFWQQQVQVRSIENQRFQLQQQWILRGALDWAGLILREDAKHSNVDTLDEPWAVQLAETRLDQYLENGRADADIADATLSGGISDAQARYNLTNLCSNAAPNPAEVSVFARLLQQQNFDPRLAQATAVLMAASLRAPATSGNDNAQQAEPQPMKLTQLDDLLAVQGFTTAMLERLRDWVIFLPRTTPVNVNTASAEVLSAMIETLTPSDAAQLVKSRETATFRDLADFANRLPGRSLIVSPSKAAVTTNFFLVNGKVHISRAEMDMQALLERNGVSTKLIWIREY